MRTQDKTVLATKMQNLLAKAGLPEERELIGRKFAFSYEVTDQVTKERIACLRITGVIYGTQYAYDPRDPDEMYSGSGFKLITSSLPHRRLDDSASPSIAFHDELGEESPPFWSIFFPHNDEEGKPDINGHEMFRGEFELL